ncbi:Mediator of RNA polymerase II transcription subunit 30 [Armadillidium vulgare]|nr:Mediator of RNA polymerase II transcription subunit 30 [Armadillidium vulgare]
MNPSSNQILRPYNNQITSSSSTATSSGSVQSSGSSNTSETFNTATLCKFGAETVQGIVSRTIEIFKELKSIQLPNGTTAGTQLSLDKKKKVLENFNEIRQLFIKLKFIYDKLTMTVMEWTTPLLSNYSYTLNIFKGYNQSAKEDNLGNKYDAGYEKSIIRGRKIIIMVELEKVSIHLIYLQEH